MTAEKLLQSLGINLERRIAARLAFYSLDDCFRDLFSFIPVRLKPLLKLGDFAGALNLDIEFDVLGQARFCEVARPDQRLSANDFQFRVGDVGLRVKFVFVVDAALDLS